jgi:putative transposase
MARLSRLCIAGEPHLVIQKSLADAPVLGAEADCNAYLACLRQAWLDCGVAVHAFALTPTQVRLLATPSSASALGTMLQAAGRRFVPAYNRRHARRGPLWDGRFHATVIDADQHFIESLLFVETAALQMGIVDQVGQWLWSSAAHHTGHGTAAGLTEHRGYWNLGNTPFEREAHYRRLLEVPLTQERRQAIERAALQGWALGRAGFIEAMSRRAKRRLQPLPPGRPAARNE